MKRAPPSSTRLEACFLLRQTCDYIYFSGLGGLIVTPPLPTSWEHADLGFTTSGFFSKELGGRGKLLGSERGEIRVRASALDD